MPSKMSKMCSGIDCASPMNSSYLTKSSSWPRIKHTVVKSSSSSTTSSLFSLPRSGRLSNLPTSSLVNSSLHSVLVSDFSYDFCPRERSLVCFNAYTASVAVYVLFSVTHIAPTLAQAKNAATYFSQFPLIIPTLSLGLMPYRSSARAKRFDCSHNRRYVHLAPVHGTITHS